jgi:hypothetical protein
MLRGQHREVALTDASRATDEELPILTPIMIELAALLDPEYTARHFSAAVCSGAKVRVARIPNITVDLVALARWVARRGGAQAIDVSPMVRHD